MSNKIPIVEPKNMTTWNKLHYLIARVAHRWSQTPLMQNHISNREMVSDSQLTLIML